MKQKFKNPVAVGLALGIFRGIGLFIFAITAWLRGYGTILVRVIETLYIGYGPSLMGAFAGLFWGFIEAFVCGFIIVILVQYFQKKLK